MEKLVSLLVLLMLFRQPMAQRDLDVDFDVDEFKRAVFQAYNTTKSFSQNFYELLGLICPESVYCELNGTFDTVNTIFQNFDIKGTYEDDDFLQNRTYDHAAIIKARAILKMNAHHLRGCCVPCSCRSDCRERQNCCPSINAQVTNESGFESPNLAAQECVYASSKSYFLEYYTFAETIGSSFYMADGCASSNMTEDIVTKCTHPALGQPDETIPVYSTDKQKLYKNSFCARCNGVSPVTAMAPLLTINHIISLTEENKLPDTFKELFRTAMSMPRFFSISYAFPSSILDINNFGCVYRPTSLTPDTLSCDRNTDLTSNQKTFFKRACGVKLHLYYTSRRPFTNVFCYMCELMHPMGLTTKPKCGTFDTSGGKHDQNSFSALLVDRLPATNNQPEATNKDNAGCNCAEVFDTSKKQCRQILCPPGDVRIVCACVPFITNVTGMRMRLHLEIHPQLPDSASEAQFVAELNNNEHQTIAKAIRRLIASQFGQPKSEGHYLFRQLTPESNLISKLHYCEVTQLQGSSDNRKKFEEMFKTLHRGLAKTIVGTQMKISLGQIFLFGSNRNVSIPDHPLGAAVMLQRVYPDALFSHRIVLGSQPLKKLLYCKRVKLEEEEIGMLYNVTVAMGWSQSYLGYVYWEDDKSMCLDDFKAMFMSRKSSGARSLLYSITGRIILMSCVWVMFDTWLSPN